MGIGVSILLMAIGAILVFAVHATVAGVDIHVVGWILMGAGVLGLLLSLVMFAPRRRRLVSETTAYGVTGSVVPDTVVRRETRDDVI